HYKLIAHRHGGFVSVEQAPVVLARLPITNSKGQESQMVWTDTGQTYYVRHQNGSEYWDDPNGMPVWKIKGGRVDLLDLNRLFDFRGYGRHPDQIFIPSKSDALKAKGLLASDQPKHASKSGASSEPKEGDFFQRRNESAPVTLTHQDGKDQLHFSVQ